jgi:hypothetical protein
MVAIVYLTPGLTPHDHFPQCQSTLPGSYRWHADDVGAADDSRATPRKLTAQLPLAPRSPNGALGSGAAVVKPTFPSPTCAPVVRLLPGTSIHQFFWHKENHVDNDKHTRDPTRLG